MTVCRARIAPALEVRFVDRPGGCERLHTHDYAVVTAVVDGSLELRVGAEVQRLEPGRAVVIAPQTPHAVCAYSPDFGGVYVLTAEAEALSEFGPGGDGSALAEVDAREFLALCETLLGPSANDAKRAAFAEWREGLAAAPANPGTPPDANRAEGEGGLAERLKALLDAEIARGAAQVELAGRFALPRTHCNRLFKARFGVSLQTYFLNGKAERARELLAGTMDLGTIAQEAGFFDQSHFTRVFRGLFQVSPLAYRRALRGAKSHSHTR